MVQECTDTETLAPVADFTLEEITVKHFVEMRRGKTERGGTRKIEAAVVILSALMITLCSLQCPNTPSIPEKEEHAIRQMGFRRQRMPEKARIAYLNQQAESAWFYLKATGVMLRVWCLRAVFSLCI